MVITVFGLGFVGLTTALGFAEFGHTVYGVEMNPERLDTIRAGHLPFLEEGLDKALLHHLNHNFHPIAPDGLDVAIAQSDCIYYCVGTPYGKDGQADLTYLLNAIDETIDLIKDYRFRVLVVKSTIPPSTTEKRIIPHIRQRGIIVGESVESDRQDVLHVGVANNPEFLREGHCWDDFMKADRIVLGISDKKSEKILREIYASTSIPVFCVSLNTGEFVKYLSNTLLATLISYSNEMSIIADTIGHIDIAKAFHILHMDKRWGDAPMSSYVYPGCGYGGYCLPKDTNALYAIAKSAGMDAPILKNVIATNDSMPAFMAERIMKVAGEKGQHSKIAILGLSFKPGSDDVRDTPSAKIIRQLLMHGYKDVLGYDPVANTEFKKHYDLPITYYDHYREILKDADILVIATAWSEFKSIHSVTDKPVIDCRYMLD